MGGRRSANKADARLEINRSNLSHGRLRLCHTDMLPMLLSLEDELGRHPGELERVFIAGSDEWHLAGGTNQGNGNGKQPGHQ